MESTMRWTRGGSSQNVEDRRGMGGGFGGLGGGGMRLGLGGIVVLLVLSVIFKRDLVSGMLGGQGSPAVSDQSGPYQESDLLPIRQAVSRRQAGPLYRCHHIVLRQCPERLGTVLLPW